MKYVLRIAVILLAVLALYYAGVFQRSEVQQKQWETKIDDRQPVTITVTPLELGKNAAAWKFNIVLDTHSGSLDEDLTQVVSLYDSKGNAYQPVSWEGAGPGGHHREGILIFKAASPAPPRIELKIQNIGGIPERSFLWDIE